MSGMRGTRAGGVLALASGLALALGACAGHGSYTRDAYSQGQQRIDALKSATEHDMAKQAYFAGDLSKALKSVDRSLALNPNVVTSHVLRGRILLEMGELDGALDALHRAEELGPENVDAQYFLGVTCERTVQLDEAITHYQRAADLDPEDAQYVVAAAEVLIDAGRVDDAEKFILSRRSVFEHNAGVRQTLGHIALIQGDDARALAMFGEARRLAPEDTDILEDLAQTQIKLGRYGEAATGLAKLLRDKDVAEHRRDLQHAYARCLVETGRFVDARDVYLGLTEGDDGAGDVEAWIGLGNVACILKDPYRQRGAANRVLALAPGREEGYLLRAIWHRRRGENDEAIKWLDAATRQCENAGVANTLRGVILTELGRTDEARESFEAALRANPNDKTIAGLLGGTDGSDD